MGQPLVALNLVGEDALQGLSVVEVFVAVEVGAAYGCCDTAANGTGQEDIFDIIGNHNVQYSMFNIQCSIKD